MRDLFDACEDVCLHVQCPLDTSAVFLAGDVGSQSLTRTWVLVVSRPRAVARTVAFDGLVSSLEEGVKREEVTCRRAGWRSLSFPVGTRAHSVSWTLIPVACLPHSLAGYHCARAEDTYRAALSFCAGYEHVVRVFSNPADVSHMFGHVRSLPGFADFNYPNLGVLMEPGKFRLYAADVDASFAYRAQRCALVAAARTRASLSTTLPAEPSVLGRASQVFHETIECMGAEVGVETLPSPKECVRAVVTATLCQSHPTSIRKSARARLDCLELDFDREDRAAVMLLRSLAWTDEMWKKVKDMEGSCAFRSASDAVKFLILFPGVKDGQCVSLATVALSGSCSMVALCAECFSSGLAEDEEVLHDISACFVLMAHLMEGVSPCSAPKCVPLSMLKRYAGVFRSAETLPNLELPFEMMVELCAYAGFSRSAARWLSGFVRPQLSDEWVTVVSEGFLNCKCGDWERGMLSLARCMSIGLADRKLFSKGGGKGTMFEMVSLLAVAMTDGLCDVGEGMTDLMAAYTASIASCARRLHLSGGQRGWHRNDDEAVSDVARSLYARGKGVEPSDAVLRRLRVWVRSVRKGWSDDSALAVRSIRMSTEGRQSIDAASMCAALATSMMFIQESCATGGMPPCWKSVKRLMEEPDGKAEDVAVVEDKRKRARKRRSKTAAPPPAAVVQEEAPPVATAAVSEGVDLLRVSMHRLRWVEGVVRVM